MPGAPNPVAIVRGQRKAVARVVQRAQGPELLAILEEAEKDLRRRLDAAELAGMGERWTHYHLQRSLVLVQDAIIQTKAQLRAMLEEHSGELVERGMLDTVRLLKAMEARGVETALPLALEDAMRFDVARWGAQASLLRQHATSLDRYGSVMIAEFERAMQLGIVAKLTPDQMVGLLVGHGGPKGVVSIAARELEDGSVVRLLERYSGQGLFVDDRYWAERIVRTELMRSYNEGTQAAILEESVTDFPDLQRMIIATFDNRTAPDSLYVHGQIRGPTEPFTDGAGRTYMVPPGRPNDREDITPWRPRWEVPEEFRPLTVDERLEATAAYQDRQREGRRAHSRLR